MDIFFFINFTVRIHFQLKIGNFQIAGPRRCILRLQKINGWTLFREFSWKFVAFIHFETLLWHFILKIIKDVTLPIILPRLHRALVGTNPPIPSGGWCRGLFHSGDWRNLPSNKHLMLSPGNRGDIYHSIIPKRISAALRSSSTWKSF